MFCGFGVEAHAGVKKLVRRGGRGFFSACNRCTARIPPQIPVTSPNHRALLGYYRMGNWVSSRSRIASSAIDGPVQSAHFAERDGYWILLQPACHVICAVRRIQARGIYREIVLTILVNKVNLRLRKPRLPIPTGMLSSEQFFNRAVNSDQVESLVAEVFKQVVPCIGRQDVIEDDVLTVSRELGYGCMHCATECRNSQRTYSGLLTMEVPDRLHASERVQLDMQVLLGQNGLKCFAQ